MSRIVFLLEERSMQVLQIENQSYEKSLLGQTNFDRALTPELRDQARPVMKDAYTFDFLELGEEHDENHRLTGRGGERLVQLRTNFGRGEDSLRRPW